MPPIDEAVRDAGLTMRSLRTAACAVGLLLACVASLGSNVPHAHEASPFDVPSGAPDDYMRTAADFAQRLAPDVHISFRDGEKGALSVVRVVDGRLQCYVRLARSGGRTLEALARFLAGRIDADDQARFAVAHEIGHCKVRAAFMLRPDGSVWDASAFPWVAQEVSADVYGILAIERTGSASSGLRQAIAAGRQLMAERLGDQSHATGGLLPQALAQCRANATDDDAVHCALDAAYLAVGALAPEGRDHESMPDRDLAGELTRLGQTVIGKEVRVYDSLEGYRRDFAGADVAAFEFRELERDGDSIYLSAEASGRRDVARRIADFYGLRVGELLDGGRTVTALRLDGRDELDWLLTLGAVVTTRDGSRLRKPSAAF